MFFILNRTTKINGPVSIILLAVVGVIGIEHVQRKDAFQWFYGAALNIILFWHWDLKYVGNEVLWTAKCKGRVKTENIRTLIDKSEMQVTMHKIGG